MILQFFFFHNKYSNVLFVFCIFGFIFSLLIFQLLFFRIIFNFFFRINFTLKSSDTKSYLSFCVINLACVIFSIFFYNFYDQFYLEQLQIQ